MLRYKCIEGDFYLPDVGAYHSYGLKIVDTDSEAVIEEVPDVSVNLDFVQKLAEEFTNAQLDPVHLLDVLMDTL